MLLNSPKINVLYLSPRIMTPVIMKNQLYWTYYLSTPIILSIDLVGLYWKDFISPNNFINWIDIDYISIMVTKGNRNNKSQSRQTKPVKFDPCLTPPLIKFIHKPLVYNFRLCDNIRPVVRIDTHCTLPRRNISTSPIQVKHPMCL